MSDSFFYTNVDSNDTNKVLFEKLEEFSRNKSKQIYVINKPLGSKYEYYYDKAVVILIPGYKIIFVNFGPDGDDFDDYYDDFIEDLGHISNKYEYRKILGRPREWKGDFFEKINYSDLLVDNLESFLNQYQLIIKDKERNGEFLISLLTGSINDVERIGGAYPESLLDKIKKKIILFDGDQTRFIYQEPTQKRITIQGLAGTGKTELLLHKLKDLYTKEPEAKIVFTCFNKVLAQNLKLRIPEFFNFMKVEEQIEWNERLWTISSWGSKSDKNSGLYSYICNYYNIPFSGYSYYTSFESVCSRALNDLEELDNFKPCFDYILIDESQDFCEAFFALCEKVAKKTVYVAGDIFQNIFDDKIVSKVTPDFLLNKCYRTDPRTLMFAHAIGMGLFEKKLRWLTDKEWEACGYIIEKKDGNYDLYRKPLRRFEDLQVSGVDSVKLIEVEDNKYSDKIIKILEEIHSANPTVKPDDIGIIFLENSNTNYQLADKLQVLISQRFGWEVNLGYQTKTKIKDTLFISNKNNVKGLEFPFVICLTNLMLGDNLQIRNSIYMMLTRSFLTSYFMLSSSNGEVITKLKDGIDTINKKGYLTVTEPSEEEKEHLRNAIINNKNKEMPKSHYEFVEQIMDKLKINKEQRERLHKIIDVYGVEDFDEDKISDIIQTNYRLM